MAKNVSVTYGIGGEVDGTPNGPDVPAHLPARNIVEWVEVDDGLAAPKPPTPVGPPTDDGYQTYLDENSDQAILYVSRPGGGPEDRAHEFHATSTDPTMLAVAIEDAVWVARSKPPLTAVTRTDIKRTIGTLTPAQFGALKASVTRRGKLT